MNYINSIPIVLFLSNMDRGGMGVSPPLLRVEIGECEICPTFQGLLIKKIIPLTLMVKGARNDFKKVNKVRRKKVSK